MKRKEEEMSRPEAYPKPTETDKQLNNQPEYIDQQPNSYEEDISDLPVSNQRPLSTEERSNDAED